MHNKQINSQNDAEKWIKENPKAIVKANLKTKREVFCRSKDIVLPFWANYSILTGFCTCGSPVFTPITELKNIERSNEKKE